MDDQKIKKFLEKLIDKTKQNQIVWGKTNEAIEKYVERNTTAICNEYKSFYTELKNNAMVVLTFEDVLEEVKLIIIEITGGCLNFCEMLKTKNTDNLVLIKRLYNLVLNRFPSVESLIDDFLNDPD